MTTTNDNVISFPQPKPPPVLVLPALVLLLGLRRR
jgi:MYXO-CTERM domain-containing protein